MIATLAGYTGIFGLYKMARGNPKPPKPSQIKKSAVVAAQPENINLPVTGGFHGPTMETFDAWSNNADNLKNWEAWVAAPGQYIESLQSATHYAHTV